jgi:hypothetical protein
MPPLQLLSPLYHHSRLFIHTSSPLSPRARLSLAPLHSGSFTLAPSLWLLHSGSFTLAPSLCLLHSGSFTHASSLSPLSPLSRLFTPAYNPWINHPNDRSTECSNIQTTEFSNTIPNIILNPTPTPSRTSALTRSFLSRKFRVVGLVGMELRYLREVLDLGLSVVECGFTVGQRSAGIRGRLLAWGRAPGWNIKADLTTPRRRRYLTTMLF